MVALGPETKRVTAAVLAEMTDLPYFRVDGDRNVVEVSRAMERLTGFEAEDVLGQSCLELHRCEECLAGCGVFEHGVVREKRLRLYRADGTTVEVSKSGRVIMDDSGNIVGALEIVRPLEAEEVEPDEASRIRHVLEQARYHRAEAARRLGLSRTTLWRKMKEYGL